MPADLPVYTVPADVRVKYASGAVLGLSLPGLAVACALARATINRDTPGCE